SGLIESFGEGVHDLKVGDPVCANCVMACGSCGFCKSGRGNLCKNEGTFTLIGIEIDGGMADYMVSKRRRLFRLPSCLPLKIGALSEPFACSLHSFEQTAKSLDPATSNTLVIGCGWTGMAMALLLHHKGFKKITVVQGSKPRRDALLRFELGICVMRPDALKQEFKDKNGRNEGFDFIFDTAGTRESLKEYLPLARRGAQFCIFGLTTKDTSLRLDAANPVDITLNEINIFGAICSNPDEMSKSIEAIEDIHKSIDLSKIGIKLYSIENYEEGFKDMQNKTATKVMFEFNA
ncbi:unnamed protein product, partial [Owenia fusiformis]